MANWVDTDNFANINSGGNYWTVGAYGGAGHWDPDDPPPGVHEAAGWASVTSVRMSVTSGGDQYVKITVPEFAANWGVVLRASSTPGDDPLHNGYTIHNQGSQYLSFKDVTGTEQVFFEPHLSGPGTIEGRVSGTVATILANGVQVGQWDYSATPSSGLYTGIYSAGSASITTAEGGDFGTPPPPTGGLKLGSTAVTALKLGTSNVAKLMLGSGQVWP